MKKIYIAILAIAVLMSGMILSGELTPIPLVKKLCCISGIYDGWRNDNASLTCTDPGAGKFRMYLYQEKGCGSKIWGKIVDTTDPGDPMKFKGSVEAGKGGCCIIRGVASKPGESVKFKGTICKVLGKWKIKNGKYTNSGGCSGYFGMVWSRAHLLLTPRIIKKKD